MTIDTRDLGEGVQSIDGVRGSGGVDEMDALGERIAASAALIDSAVWSLLTDLRAFDEGGGWYQQGALSAAHWLQWRVGIDLGAAREKVRVARALGIFRLFDEALRRGQISYSKLRAMTRVVTPENEAALLELGRACTASQLEKTCRIYRQQQAPEQEALEASRMMRVRQSDDGLLTLQVKLTAAEADLVMRACEISAESGHAVHGLLAMAERTLRGEPLGGDGRDGGAPPTEVVVHVEAKTLAGSTEGGYGISAETSRRLLCDAGIVPMVDGADGEPLNVGRRRRTVPAALRRAVKARDGGCRFPGCTNRLVDVHHLVHWIDGSETSLQNSVSCCRSHHRMLHEEGFRVSRDAEGELVFHDPAGRRVPRTGTREGQQDGGLLVIEGRARGRGDVIDAMTACPLWEGEPFDCDAALQTLVDADLRA